MAQLGHSDGQKASFLIDPSRQSPSWPLCGHFESFAKSPSPTGSQEQESASPPTHQNTVWPLYRDWILDGSVDTRGVVGEYRVWKLEDEFDPLERTEVIHHLVDFGVEDALEGYGTKIQKAKL